MLNKSMFSSNSSEYETPQWLFDKLNEEFNFTLDVCARPDNTKCKLFFTPAQNGLAQRWTPHICWMNPPYGRQISQWVKKAYIEAQKGATVVCLLPARTDTKWWHDYVMKATEIRFIKGRLRFSNTNNSAPFPSVIVIFKNTHNKVPTISTLQQPA